MSVKGPAPAPQPVHCGNSDYFRKEKVKLLRIKQDLLRRAAVQDQILEAEKKAQRAKERKQAENAERIIRGAWRDELNKERRQRLLEAEQNRKRHLIANIVTKEVDSQVKKKWRDLEAANAKEEKAQEWIHRKYKASKSQVEKEVLIKAVQKVDLKQRAAKRQDRIERARERHAAKKEAERKKAERENILAEKFGTLWLNKTRSKMQARAKLLLSSNKHKSAFIDVQGKRDPIEQAQADLMAAEPAMKAILTLMHKEKTQFVASYISSLSPRTKTTKTKSVNLRPVPSEHHLPTFSHLPESSLRDIKEYTKPLKSHHTTLST